MISFLLLLTGSLAQECVVSPFFVDRCTNGEVCTSVGCRCVDETCFHVPDDKCLVRNTCGKECCRSGEVCASQGCICAEDTKCAPPPCTGECQSEASHSLMGKTKTLKLQGRVDCYSSGRCARNRGKTHSGAEIPCVNGFAGEYPCQNVSLLAHITCKDLGGDYSGYISEGNDIWGWESGNRDFAIAGLTTGTSFVEVTDPLNPVVLGFLPVQPGSQSSSIWRDIKVYRDAAFIVSEATGSGMQVFDLTRLLNVQNPGPTNLFTADSWFNSNMGTASQRSTHNIFINEETGFAYLVGCRTCSGGLLMVDISQPLNPTYAGCFSGDGYSHDVQCVNYTGPDRRFLHKEICFGFNEDSLTIVDVTVKTHPVQLSRTGYRGMTYTHQGWLTEDQKYLLLDDELDEVYDTFDTSKKTNTYIWNVEDLTTPVNEKNFQAPVQSIDHNQYIRGDFSFQANYASGLRILKGLRNPSEEVALEGYFDVYPEEDVAEFYGAWSTWPYFTGANSDTVIIQSIEGGLFVVKFAGLK